VRTRSRTASMVKSVVGHLPSRKHGMAYEYPSRSDASTELRLRKALPRSPQCRSLNALQKRLLQGGLLRPAYSAAPLNGERYSSEQADGRFGAKTGGGGAFGGGAQSVAVTVEFDALEA